MDDKQQADDPYKTAERRISEVLAELESVTGCWVTEVEIRDIEVTKMEDDRPQFRRFPHIIVKAKPGAGWG